MFNDILKIYDVACMNFMKQKMWIPTREDLRGINAIEPDEDIEVTLDRHFHHATPDRPFGFEVPTDPLTGNMDTKRLDLMLQTPQISLTRLSFQYSMDRNNTNDFRKVRWWDESRKMWVQSAYPRPWNIPYQIDVTCRLRKVAQRTINYFLYYIQPVRVLYADFKYPWGRKGISMMFSEIQDNTHLETEEELRYYRFTIPFYLEAYAFEVLDNPSEVENKATNPEAFTSLVRSVHSFNLELCDIKGNSLGYWNNVY